MELMGQRGLAWRGDVRPPEGLKTHTIDTHTHAVDTQATHTLAEGTRLLAPSDILCGDSGTRDQAPPSEEALIGPEERPAKGQVVPSAHAPSQLAPTGSPAQIHPPSDPQTGAPASLAAPQEPLGAQETDLAPGEPQVRAAPRPTLRVLHACRERAAQLEACLERARGSLAEPERDAGMQDSVEQQLLTCQEMFLEIEQKVSSLSALGQQEEEQEEEERGSAGAHPEAEALSSRLKVLKTSLVTFQLLLQERRGEEQISPPRDRPLEARLKRSASVQEMLSSPKSKLTRQRSLQQQKELEQELSEQRGLTKAIARQGSRARLHSLDQDEPAQTPAGLTAAEPQVEQEAAVRRKWTHLHHRLLALEESVLQSSSQVTDASVSWGVGAAGVTGTLSLQELQTHAGRLRELGHTASQVLAQAVPVEDAHQKLDEGLFDVLCGAALSLSSLNALLQSDPGPKPEDTSAQLLQLTGLSAALESLAGELSTQGSEVTGVLGSELGQLCVGHLGRLLPVVQTGLASRQRQLQTQVETIGQHQRQLKDLHAALISNKVAIHQMTNEATSQDTSQQLQAVTRVQEDLQLQSSQASSLLQADRQGLSSALMEETTQLEGVLETVLGSVGTRCEELRGSVGLQQQYERLLHSLRELVVLGTARLSQRPGMELRSTAQLQGFLNTHTRFFQFLGTHLSTLQYLSNRLPDGAPQRWKVELTELRGEVARLQQQALERGTRLQGTLQMWTEQEDDSTWLDALLSDMETTCPRVHLEEDSEEQICVKLSVYQKIRGVLEDSRVRSDRLQEQGRRLQQAGCRGVAVSSRGLEARWSALYRRVEHDRSSIDKNRRLWSRFSRDSVTLSEWMGGAREVLSRWSQLPFTANQERDLQQDQLHYQQFMDFSKELEATSGLKVSVMTSGAQLVQLREAERLPETRAGLCSVQTQLRQMEQDWAVITADVPVVRHTLHQRLMESLPPQGAVAELLTWVGGAEARLEDQRDVLLKTTSATKPDLTRLLQRCKECQTEMAQRQLTVDYVNQSGLQLGSVKGQGGRYEHTHFAEELGHLNQRWLRLHGALNSQVQTAEQQLRSRSETEARLQQLSSWATSQREWMSSAALTPTSLSEVARAMETCEALEEKIRLNSAALQELRDKHPGGAEDSACNVISQISAVTKACSALAQQNTELRLRLKQLADPWASLQNGLREAALKTLKTQQMIEYYCSPQLSLQAHQDLHDRLQVLHEETEEGDSEWDRLSRTLATLRDMVGPTATDLLTEQLNREKARWAQVSRELESQLLKSRSVLEVWRVYRSLSEPLSQRLHTQQNQLAALLDGPPGNTAESHLLHIHTLHSLQERAESLQADLEGVLEASKDLTALMEPSAAVLIQSESRLLTRGVLQLIQTLSGKLGHLQEELEPIQEFDRLLESLEGHLQDWEDRLRHGPPHGDVSTPGLLELSGLSPDLDVLNDLGYRVTLSEAASLRLQGLNRSWAQTSTRALEACSELQTEELGRRSFEQKCESWMAFLQRMEDSLAVDLASTYAGLREQLRIHQRFQAELSIGHQILHSVINEALHLLQRGEVEDRSDFILKLAQLREHWQGAVRRAAQRRALVEVLVKQWHLYGRGLKKLQGFLADAQTLLPPAGPAHCSLLHLRRYLQDLKHTELLFQRYQGTYIHTLELGRQLFSMGDQPTQTQLQTELATLQEDWETLQGLLGKRKDLVHAIVQNWERCEAGLVNSNQQLKSMKTRLNQSIPEHVDELPDTEQLTKEAEDSLEDWAESLTELATMKTDLSQYIIADDVLLLQEQVEHLHCQWDELCLKVSLRKQEIADRLNAWIIFNEKNKELCEWLTQMENKVAHNSDLSIEEMVEKLKKDCMEEINLFSENKTHLKQLGEQLMTASNKTKETEINDKLKDINDRWQHLFDHIEARVRKLKETLITVQQLDKNMSNLRTWLSRVEAELAKPVVYSICHSDEIQRKLAEQQDLQRDIEQHTEGVASVLTLCDVLLHDADACGSDAENDSIQQTTRSLDRRWRNICAMSMERRMRIEETWRLWCKFLDDYSRFEDWLRTAERTAANPVSADVLYTSAKEELKKFEAFQRQVHERLTQLELVNKQYRRLARENRTDAASKLKVMVHEGNQRWDCLQKRVAAVLRRLKHFTAQREEFEGTREGILVWLTEMDLQLTNVEHFSESDIEDKMRQLNGFQQEITLNTNKIDALIVFGENLIQKSAPLDAVLIEDELEELHSYCQEVFGRVARFHHRLTNRRPVVEDDRDLSDRDTDLEDSAELPGGSWREEEDDHEEKEEDEGSAAMEAAGRQAACHLLAPPLERSGRETPVSVDSIPLEWDHTVDVGGSSSHEDEEEATFYSALSVKSVMDPPSWHSPAPQERKRVPRDVIRALGSSPTHMTSTPFHHQGYAKLMSECTGSIDSVKRVKLILKDDEEPEEDRGLTALAAADKQTGAGVIERWELLQARALGDQLCITQDLQQWQKLNSDLADVTSWLGRVLAELERLQRLAPASGVRDMEGNIRRLKEMQKSFNGYKSLMISINLNGRNFQRGDSVELQELQDGLRCANHSWTQACAGLESWERRLHTALMQCQEFHETLHSLLLWLARAESRRYAVNIHDRFASRTSLLEHRGTLVALEEELRGRQLQVSSLQEISSQLLLEATAEDSVEAKEKVHVISNKLRLLLRQVANDLHVLQGRLEWCPVGSEMDSVGLGSPSSPLLLQKEQSGMAAAGVRPSGSRREEKRDSSPARSFFQRVLRAALPLHLLLLLLLVLACLVPISEDYSCTMSNNFARSFYPMLRYTNGPPPT